MTAGKPFNVIAAGHSLKSFLGCLFALCSTNDETCRLSTYDKSWVVFCRHYVNNLVRQTTGVPGATTRLIRHHFRLQRQHCMRWNDRILAFGHHFTDVNNWPRILAAGKATVGLAILLSGGETYLLASIILEGVLSLNQVVEAQQNLISLLDEQHLLQSLPKTTPALDSLSVLIGKSFAFSLVCIMTSRRAQISIHIRS